MNEHDVLTEQKKNRWRRVTAVGAAGLVAGLLAVGLGSAASAQTVITEPVESTTAEPAAVGFASASQVEDEEPADSNAEEEVLFEQYDQCLKDAGLDLESESATDGAELDDATIEAAFEKCDPILGELGDGFADISPEDEAVFERYDECLQGAGLDFESDVEPSDAEFEAAFDQCDPILEDLSEALQGDVDFGVDLSPEDEAVFERYDTCLENAGLDFDTEAELDDATLEAAFEQCDPILDELSEAAHELLDCPEAE